jgi:acyl-CoA thioesterase I
VGQRTSVRRSVLKTSIVGTLLASVSACGGGGVSNPPPASGATPDKWVILGSSTAAGTGATVPANSWAMLLQAGIPSTQVQVVNLAKSGATTYEGLATGSPQVTGRPSPDPTENITAALAQAPKVVLLAYPTNDTAFDYAVTETVNNLLAMRAAATANNTTVIVLSTQPRDLTATQLAQLVEIDTAMSAAVGACFVAVRADLAGVDSKLDPTYDSVQTRCGDQAEKLDPQPQVVVAFGFLITNCAPCRSSL